MHPLKKAHRAGGRTGWQGPVELLRVTEHASFEQGTQGPQKDWMAGSGEDAGRK